MKMLFIDKYNNYKLFNLTYGNLSGIMTQNILSYALSNDCKIGFSSGTFPGNSYTEELPDEGIKYGTWEITKRSQNTITIKVFSPYKSTMWVNSYVNTAGWNGWKQMVVNTDLNPEVYIVPRPSDNSNFTFGNRTFQAYVRKSGKVVTIQLNISASMASVSDFVTAFTIPQKYNPLSDVIVNYTTQNTNKPMILFITKNGEIKFSNFNTAIDDWLCRQCITYVTN